MTSMNTESSLARVVLASNNPGKLREFSALFAPLGIELVPQGELGVPEAEEPHVTFVENALAKARHASLLTRSEEHTSELQSLMRTSYAVFCLKKKKKDK